MISACIAGASSQAIEKGIEQREHKIQPAAKRLPALRLKSNNSNADVIF
jgi:hypothetical protein